jgi:mRNA interferase HigB
MYLLTNRTLDAFARDHADAREALAEWAACVTAAHWATPAEALRAFPGRVRALDGGRLIFDIRGNAYRIVCSVRWADLARRLGGIVRIEFVGSHADYDKIDAKTVTFSRT